MSQRFAPAVLFDLVLIARPTRYYALHTLHVEIYYLLVEYRPVAVSHYYAGTSTYVRDHDRPPPTAEPFSSSPLPYPTPTHPVARHTHSGAGRYHFLPTISKNQAVIRFRHVADLPTATAASPPSVPWRGGSAFHPTAPSSPPMVTLYEIGPRRSTRCGILASRVVYSQRRPSTAHAMFLTGSPRRRRCN